MTKSNKMGNRKKNVFFKCRNKKIYDILVSKEDVENFIKLIIDTYKLYLYIFTQYY